MYEAGKLGSLPEGCPYLLLLTWQIGNVCSVHSFVCVGLPSRPLNSKTPGSSIIVKAFKIFINNIFEDSRIGLYFFCRNKSSITMRSLINSFLIIHLFVPFLKN